MARRCRRRGALPPRRAAGPYGSGDRERAHDFSFTFALQELCESWEGGPEVWDLWLRPADGSAAARVARLLDDVAEKGQVFVYPAQPVDAPYAPAQAGPYYTADNDLAIRVDERPPVR
ncbi:hypothetical protein GCM10020221_00340 [Streptomyces thioluteus]|uniref:Uncharacterized protein n=1 Tax=Streptomyces thioluteus TaxID=66431 RepID=A0ABN3WAY3_STRTU